MEILRNPLSIASWFTRLHLGEMQMRMPRASHCARLWLLTMREHVSLALPVGQPQNVFILHINFLIIFNASVVPKCLRQRYRRPLLVDSAQISSHKYCETFSLVSRNPRPEGRPTLRRMNRKVKLGFGFGGGLLLLPSIKPRLVQQSPERVTDRCFYRILKCGPSTFARRHRASVAPLPAAMRWTPVLLRVPLPARRSLEASAAGS